MISPKEKLLQNYEKSRKKYVARMTRKLKRKMSREALRLLEWEFVVEDDNRNPNLADVYGKARIDEHIRLYAELKSNPDGIGWYLSYRVNNEEVFLYWGNAKEYIGKRLVRQNQ